MEKMRAVSKILAAVVVGGGMLGCAHTGVSQAPEEIVKQRSTGFWDARLKDDVAAAYAYTSPAYRKLNNMERFRMDYAGKPMTTKRTIEGVNCNVELKRCTVKQKFTVVLPLRGAHLLDVYDEEVWLEDEGQWWVYRK